jgi:hypothetical protein
MEIIEISDVDLFGLFFGEGYESVYGLEELQVVQFLSTLVRLSDQQ